jgi:hypothetical protein
VRDSLLAKQPDNHGNGCDWKGDHYADHQQFSGARHQSEWHVHAATILAAASPLQIFDFVGNVCLPDFISINLGIKKLQ